MSDYSHDMNLHDADYFDDSHLYLWGMKKASRWFADEILSEYDFPDRRGTELAVQWDEWYRQWERNTQYMSPLKSSE